MATHTFQILLFVLTIFSVQALAEPITADTKGKVNGTVIDASNGQAVPYATIAIHRHAESAPLSGAITGEAGDFGISQLEWGSYDVVVSFMGYEPIRFNAITIDAHHPVISLGKVRLNPSSEQLAEVDVVGRRNAMEYKIDKKVVPVSRQLNAVSLTAVEVLENVPSIKVDADGEVSLRGSSSFTVLIDSRPTILDPSDALRQIPSSSIENIEIITNPSVKYAPDGTSGIINIITKKNMLQGLQGQISANAGLDHKYGADALFSLRHKRWAYSMSVNFANKQFPGTSRRDRTTIDADTSYIVHSTGGGHRHMKNANVNLSVDYSFTDADVITVGLSGGQMSFSHNVENDYFQTVMPQNITTQSLSTEESLRKRKRYKLSLGYQHTFAKDHTLNLSYDMGWMRPDGRSSSSLETNGSISSLMNDELSRGHRSEFKLDYTRSLGSNSKVEAGLQARNNKSDSNNDLYIDNVRHAEFCNTADFRQGVYSAYVSASSQLSSLGLQAGLRAEYLDRSLTVNETNTKHTLTRTDLFPTLHISYNLPSQNQLMASYTRRTNRLRNHFLFPYLTYMDAYNVRQGDPTLHPEMIDSYELSYVKQFDKAQISAELFSRTTHNKIEFLTSAYNGGTAIHNPANVGKDYSTGFEGNVNFSPLKFWETTLMGDIYRYKMDGSIGGKPYTRSVNNWSARWNNSFILHRQCTAQLNYSYDSKTINSQGTTRPRYSFDAAVKADFLKKQLAFVLQARDVFATSQFRNTIDTNTVKGQSVNKMKAPQVSLTVTYRINNYTSKRKPSVEEEINDAF